MKKQRKKKKGFTLLELLAVIIILAIIALISTPIIMRVIENSKKAAAERGAENYVREVETEAMALRGQGTILEGTYSITENGNLCPGTSTDCSEQEEIKIEMSGKKPSSGTVVMSGGKVVARGDDNTITTLTLEDYVVKINSDGSASATKESSSQKSFPDYYSFTSSGSVGSRLEFYPMLNSDSSEEHIYLGFDSADGETIDAAYVCFKKEVGAKQYCLKGNDSNAYEDNVNMLNEAFPDFCFPDDNGYACDDGNFKISVTTLGSVSAREVYYSRCVVQDGIFNCDEE